MAAKFAALMDRDRFREAERLLAVDCRYRFRGRTIVGAKKVMGLYRANATRGRRLLDGLEFESKVEGFVAGSVGILYTDRLRKGRHSHNHRCRQFLRIRKGKISHIRHSDLRGEARALKAFFRRAGVDWE